MKDKVLKLEQFLKEKEKVLHQIEACYFQCKLFFEQKGIKALLKGNDFLKQGFNAQEANDKLQDICRKTTEELDQIYSKKEELETRLKKLNKEIDRFK
ncbi:hypothetical protein [Acinetobacter pseudolwoffii]|uniref:hypothetical protein n=1 Tax=Acinetobacter pseudolwoffii TaxID=2053287 RepID=UPI0025765D2E|nr:hypothetical protein [Acinetobacter pseudolwoffii]MDM1323468.1 hypothetical protein [Acinetobacter pseudolwoffii]